MLLTLALVRLLGARRTRVLAQVRGARSRARCCSCCRRRTTWSRTTAIARRRQRAGATARRVRPAGARTACCGCRAAPRSATPLPLLALVAAGSGRVRADRGRTHRFFVHGLQQAAGTAARVRARRGRGARARCARSLFDTVVVKEWRLIARDPHLISQVLLQLVYLVPLFVPDPARRRHARPGDRRRPHAAVQLARGQPGLDRASRARTRPTCCCRRRRPRRTHPARQAGRQPRCRRWLLVALPLLWLVVRAPLTGLLVCFTVTAAVLGAGLIVLWVGRPAPRSDFRTRGKENFLCSCSKCSNSLCWGGLAWLLRLARRARRRRGCLAARRAALALGWACRCWPGCCGAVPYDRNVTPASTPVVLSFAY